MATPGASSRACGNSPAVGNLHLHLDTVNEIELCGGERVFVYGTPGLSSPWPALTVPKALIPLPKFDAAKNRGVLQTHACVMLLGLTNHGAYSEKFRGYFVYVPASTCVTSYTRFGLDRTKQWVEGFALALWRLANEKSDFFTCADGLDAARRFFAPLRQTRSGAPCLVAQREFVELTAYLQDTVCGLIQTYAGYDVLADIGKSRGGACGILRNNGLANLVTPERENAELDLSALMVAAAVLVDERTSRSERSLRFAPPRMGNPSPLSGPDQGPAATINTARMRMDEANLFGVNFADRHEPPRAGNVSPYTQPGEGPPDDLLRGMGGIGGIGEMQMTLRGVVSPGDGSTVSPVTTQIVASPRVRPHSSPALATAATTAAGVFRNRNATYAAAAALRPSFMEALVPGGVAPTEPGASPSVVGQQQTQPGLGPFQEQSMSSPYDPLAVRLLPERRPTNRSVATPASPTPVRADTQPETEKPKSAPMPNSNAAKQTANEHTSFGASRKRNSPGKKQKAYHLGGGEDGQSGGNPSVIGHGGKRRRKSAPETVDAAVSVPQTRQTRPKTETRISKQSASETRETPTEPDPVELRTAKQLKRNAMERVARAEASLDTAVHFVPLTKHDAAEDARALAACAACFASPDADGRTRELSGMGQKELRETFRVAFRQGTFSNNDPWLRKQIGGALGLDAEPGEPPPAACAAVTETNAALIKKAMAKVLLEKQSLQDATTAVARLEKGYQPLKRKSGKHADQDATEDGAGARRPKNALPLALAVREPVGKQSGGETPRRARKKPVYVAPPGPFPLNSPSKLDLAYPGPSFFSHHHDDGDETETKTDAQHDDVDYAGDRTETDRAVGPAHHPTTRSLALIERPTRLWEDIIRDPNAKRATRAVGDGGSGGGVGGIDRVTARLAAGAGGTKPPRKRSRSGRSVAVSKNETADEKASPPEQALPETATETADHDEPYVTRIPFSVAVGFLKHVSKRTPGDAFQMAPAPASVVRQSLFGVGFNDSPKKAVGGRPGKGAAGSSGKDKPGLDSNQGPPEYKCVCVPPDRERLTDFSVTRFGPENAPVESYYAQISQGVTPERILRTKGTLTGIDVTSGTKKALHVAAALGSFGVDDGTELSLFPHTASLIAHTGLTFSSSDVSASDVESARFSGTFVEQGGCVLRHFFRDANLPTHCAVGGGRDTTTTRNRIGASTSSDMAVALPPGGGKHAVAVDKQSAPVVETVTTWSGRRSTPKVVLGATVEKPSPKPPAVSLGPNADVTNWLVSVKRTLKGDTVSAACAYVTQRLVPRVLTRAPEKVRIARLPKDETGNPVAAFSENKNDLEETRNAVFFDDGDDAFSPNALLPAVTIETVRYDDPESLLNNPIEVSYLGVKAVPGAGGALWAAFGDAQRLNEKRTPKFVESSDCLRTGDGGGRDDNVAAGTSRDTTIAGDTSGDTTIAGTSGNTISDGDTVTKASQSVPTGNGISNAGNGVADENAAATREKPSSAQLVTNETAAKESAARFPVASEKAIADDDDDAEHARALAASAECFTCVDDESRVLELRKMPQGELKKTFEKLFGWPAKSNDNQWLREKIAGELGLGARPDTHPPRPEAVTKENGAAAAKKRKAKGTRGTRGASSRLPVETRIPVGNDGSSSKKNFYRTTLPLDDLFDTVRQGGEMMRDMRLADREKFGLMHGRSGMPIRFRYLEVCVDTLSVLKKEQEVFRLRNFQRSGEGRKDRHREPAERKDATETTYTPWDPREIVRRPGNVVVTLHKTLRQQREGILSSLKSPGVDTTTTTHQPVLRFYAAGSMVPLRVNRPFAFSEITFVAADKTRGDARTTTKRGERSRKVSRKAYETVTHTKAIIESTGFVWYTVPRSDVRKLVGYVREMAGEGLGKAGGGSNPEDGYTHASNADYSSTMSSSLLDTGHTWLDPAGIAKWNSTRHSGGEKIHVYRHVQRAGEHFARAPGAARWGFCVGGCWLVESEFAFAEDWLSVAKEADVLEDEARVQVFSEESEKEGGDTDPATDHSVWRKGKETVRTVTGAVTGAVTHGRDGDTGRVPRFATLDEITRRRLSPTELRATGVGLACEDKCRLLAASVEVPPAGGEMNKEVEKEVSPIAGDAEPNAAEILEAETAPSELESPAATTPMPPPGTTAEVPEEGPPPLSVSEVVKVTTRTEVPVIPGEVAPVPSAPRNTETETKDEEELDQNLMTGETSEL